MMYCTNVKTETNKTTSLNVDSETTPLLPDKDGATSSSSSSSAAAAAEVAVLQWLKGVLPFVGVFGPMVVFWAVFYQQNTTWVVQATNMDCYLGRLHVPPGTKRKTEQKMS